MTASNRADRIELLFKVLKKHFRPTAIATDRPVLDLLLYACCLEDARYEQADEAFARLQQSYFDWNEVRVTTVAELSEVLQSLPHPSVAAVRVKKNLQAMFESRYSFEIDDMKKMNLGKAVADLEGWVGSSKFVVGFVTQHALGGHAIPIDASTVEVLRICEIITLQEAEKNQAPGMERAIAKSKGPEFGSLIHQFAAEYRAEPKSAAVVATFKEMGVVPKPRPAPVASEKKTARPSSSPPQSAAISEKAKDGKTREPATKKAEPTKPLPGKTVPTKPQPLPSKPLPAKPLPAKPVGSKPTMKRPETGKEAGPAEGIKEGRKGTVPAPAASATPPARPDRKTAETKPAEPKKSEPKKPEMKAAEAKKANAKAPKTKQKTKPPKGESKPVTKKPAKDTKSKGVKPATKKPSMTAKKTSAKPPTKKPGAKPPTSSPPIRTKNKPK